MRGPAGTRWNERRLTIKALRVLLAVWIGLGAGLVHAPSVARAAESAGSRVFTLDGGWVRGSVALGDLDGDGVPDIVVGGDDGVVHAYRGDGVRLWQYDVGSAAIEGKAAIGDVNADGWNEVLIGVGSTFTPRAPGAMWAFAHDGTPLWHYPKQHRDNPCPAEYDFDEDGVCDGVYSTPALADLDGDDGGKLEIIYGSWDGHVRALNHDGTPVWELFTRDTVWSSPAVGDVDRDGRLEVVIGSDAHREPAFGTEDGGKLYVLNGEDGSELPGFFKQIDEVIWSSPALGDLDGDGWLDIVVGTGDCYEHPACGSCGRTHPVTDALYGWDHLGNPLPGWPISLSEYAFASPALGDMDGDGDLEIVINTDDGYVHAFHGDGSAVDGWPVLVTTPAGPGWEVHFSTWASPILADLTGDGGLEVILPSNWEIVVWDREGRQLTRDQFPPAAGQWTLDTEYTVQSTPAVGDVDGDGKMELVVGGARAGGAKGALYVWDFDDAPANGPAPWSHFRQNSVNNARYLHPHLVIGPASLILMQEYGSSLSEGRTLWIANQGDGEIAWQIDAFPPGLTVTPLSGTVDRMRQAVNVTLSVSSCLTGTHAIGEIVITGRVNGDVASGSPVTVPITLRVGAVHRSFLPLVASGSP